MKLKLLASAALLCAALPASAHEGDGGRPGNFDGKDRIGKPPGRTHPCAAVLRIRGHRPRRDGIATVATRTEEKDKQLTSNISKTTT